MKTNRSALIFMVLTLLATLFAPQVQNALFNRADVDGVVEPQIRILDPDTISDANIKINNEDIYKLYFQRVNITNTGQRGLEDLALSYDYSNDIDNFNILAFIYNCSPSPRAMGAKELAPQTPNYSREFKIDAFNKLNGISAIFLTNKKNKLTVTATSPELGTEVFQSNDQLVY